MSYLPTPLLCNARYWQSTHQQLPSDAWYWYIVSDYCYLPTPYVREVRY